MDNIFRPMIVIAGMLVFMPATLAAQSVSGSGALRNSLSNASAGDTIVVASGSYSGDFSISRSGTASNPITIRAATRGGPVFNSSLVELRGNHIIFEGMTFDDGQVSIIGDSNRVTRNVFKNGGTGGNSSKLSSAVEAEGANNRIDHNEVVNWHRRGLRTRPDNGTKNNRFDHNYLHNFSADGNSGEALQSGTGPDDTNLTGGAIFEYNLLDNVEADAEAISVKSSGNIVQYNTFKNSDATVNNRHGSNNMWRGNTIIDMNAMGIYGDDNKVIGNDVRNSYIIIRKGDITQDQVPDGSGGHPAARNTLVACNKVTGGYIGVGTRIPGGSSSGGIPARNTTLANNNASIEYDSHTGTKNGSFDCGSVQAVELSPSEVGPNAAGDGATRGDSSGSNTPGPCSLYSSGASAYTPYGIVWDWTTTQRELLLKATCSSANTTIDIGNGRETGSGANLAGLTYVYHQGYYSTGSGWLPYSLQCSGADKTAIVGVWCKGSATASLPSSAKWFVGYTCIWTGSKWQCGCSDATCTLSYWQVQGIKR